MSEQKVQAKIITYLEANDFYVVKTIVSNKKGVPDLLACSPRGKFVAIEVKYGKNKASKLQEHNIQRIVDNGGFAMVCWDVKELKVALEVEGVI
jgi:Holliday junction resolvase